MKQGVHCLGSYSDSSFTGTKTLVEGDERNKSCKVKNVFLH